MLGGGGGGVETPQLDIYYTHNSLNDSQLYNLAQVYRLYCLIRRTPPHPHQRKMLPKITLRLG